MNHIEEDFKELADKLHDAIDDALLTPVSFDSSLIDSINEAIAPILRNSIRDKYLLVEELIQSIEEDTEHKWNWQWGEILREEFLGIEKGEKIK